jgi:hypothetical protein
MERFVELMVEPYREVWRDFHPVVGVQTTAGAAGGKVPPHPSLRSG